VEVPVELVRPHGQASRRVQVPVEELGPKGEGGVDMEEHSASPSVNRGGSTSTGRSPSAGAPPVMLVPEAVMRIAAASPPKAKCPTVAATASGGGDENGSSERTTMASAEDADDELRPDLSEVLANDGLFVTSSQIRKQLDQIPDDILPPTLPPIPMDRERNCRQ